MLAKQWQLEAGVNRSIVSSPCLADSCSCRFAAADSGPPLWSTTLPWSTTLFLSSTLVHHSVLVLHSGPPLCSGPGPPIPPDRQHQALGVCGRGRLFCCKSWHRSERQNGSQDSGVRELLLQLSWLGPAAMPSESPSG